MSCWWFCHRQRTLRRWSAELLCHLKLDWGYGSNIAKPGKYLKLPYWYQKIIEDKLWSLGLYFLSHSLILDGTHPAQQDTSPFGKCSASAGFSEGAAAHGEVFRRWGVEEVYTNQYAEAFLFGWLMKLSAGLRHQQGPLQQEQWDHWSDGARNSFLQQTRAVWRESQGGSWIQRWPGKVCGGGGGRLGPTCECRRRGEVHAWELEKCFSYFLHALGSTRGFEFFRMSS